MGNHRFSFSDMVPNAWLHKLRAMGRPARTPPFPHLAAAGMSHLAPGPDAPHSPPAPPQLLPRSAEQTRLQPRRASCYVSSRRQEKPPESPAHPRASDTLFPADTPRMSKKKARRKQGRPAHVLARSASGGDWACRVAHGAVVEGQAAPELAAGRKAPAFWGEGGDEVGGGDMPCLDKLVVAEHYARCEGGVEASEENYGCGAASDVAPAGDVGRICKAVSPANEHLVAAVGRNGIPLPAILTKPVKKDADAGPTISKARSRRKPASPPPPPPLRQAQDVNSRRPPAATQGLRMRAASPRLAGRKSTRSTHRITRKAAAAPPRKRLSESFAVVKCSSDPRRDFRDSMVEMIAENNLRSSSDLEDLLACYLSLNETEYHDVIVKVFEQIWRDLTA